MIGSSVWFIAIGGQQDELPLLTQTPHDGVAGMRFQADLGEREDRQTQALPHIGPSGTLEKEFQDVRLAPNIRAEAKHRFPPRCGPAVFFPPRRKHIWPLW